MNKAEIIETLLAWNFWERDISTGIPRAGYRTALKRYLKTDEIVAVAGVRRSGKSTILVQMLAGLIEDNVPKANTLYVNFEDPKFYSFLGLQLLDDIWSAYSEYLTPKGRIYLVLDEIQRVKGWERWVMARYDRKENLKVFVTGSNAEFLCSEYSSVLTGRHIELFVSPLGFGEFLEFNSFEPSLDKLQRVSYKKDLKILTQKYLQRGGFPKIVLTADELLRKELLAQYFHDILTRDIADRHKVKELGKLKNLALFYAANFTRLYSFNKVKQMADFRLSVDSIDRFSRYLQDSFLVDFVPRFSYSLKNQMQTARKVYFVDNGMRQAVAFQFSEDKGKLLENAVFQELKRRKSEIYYFQEKQEVDFVVKKGQKIEYLINACYELGNRETAVRETAALKEAMKYFKLNHARLIVAEGERDVLKEEGFKIDVIPFYEWALAEND